MAVCQGEGVVWSGALRDGNSVVLLLREQLRPNWKGFLCVGGKWFGEMGEGAMGKGWGTPGTRVYGQGAGGHALWGE